MGAPRGHPFFGNQHTDGGYIRGSFTYAGKLVERGVDVVKSVASGVGTSTSSKVATVATSEQTAKNFVTSLVDKISSNGLNKKHLIATGIITVAVTGGILSYRHFNKKRKNKNETIESFDFSVGVCVKCGEPLVESTFVPRSEGNKNNDAYIICKTCSEKNFAWYPNENLLS